MKKKTGKALVVGAGISGLRSALDLAETGYQVTLIDRAPHIGGILSQLDNQFPSNHCGMCKMLPLVRRDASSQYCLRKGLFHENINILLSTELAALEGEPGRFLATLHRKPAWVDPELCLGCGLCLEVCPVDAPDLFNQSLGRRKAIYRPVPHAIPTPFLIDTATCTKCGECARICPAGAVRIPEQAYGDFPVLVVDDELIVRDSLKELLEDEGFAVDMAGSGPEALEKLAEQPFRLMLTDIKMPGMDGVQLLQKAREDHPDLVVVMMTAYATVETAVAAMKLGARDYLIKPFEPETLLPLVVGIYQASQEAEGLQLEVGAVVLSGGTSYYDPLTGFNPYGYGLYPNVVTGLEFERLMSGTGPTGGQLVRPSDQRPIRRVAWLQCVGSRDVDQADYCSSVCCMYALKEAVLAKDKTNGELEAVIYYMDMRTLGKDFQRYRDQAEKEHGIQMERVRVHSITPHPPSGDLVIRTVDADGGILEKSYDLVVLSVGQRPAAGMAELAKMLGLSLNKWGFGQTEPLSPSRTNREGIVLSGSFAGLKDIGESVIQAGSAALAASRVIHAGGGSLALETGASPTYRDVSRESPRVLVAVCTCRRELNSLLDGPNLTARLARDPAVVQSLLVDDLCGAQSWAALEEAALRLQPNRILLGACLPYVYANKLRELGAKIKLDPGLMEVVDIRTQTSGAEPNQAGLLAETAMKMGLARVKPADPTPAPTVPVFQRLLVIGGGPAGLTAALAVADHGYPVDLVEEADTLGGNLNRLHRTLEGHDLRDLLASMLEKVERHPLITVHTGARIINAFGQVGQFNTTIQGQDKRVEIIEHGAVILATGGQEATTSAYGHGQSDLVVTQMEFEQKLAAGLIDPAQLKTVAMIQCVDSREEPRNYCSRVCCPTALKNALLLKERNPEVGVYVMYRDLMAPGFAEEYFTQARRAGVVFIPYEVSAKPLVSPGPDQVQVDVFYRTIGRDVRLEADLLILATGIVPRLPQALAQSFGAELNQDGFFKEAESKWRPVDALAEGVFACGLAHSPRAVVDSIATAEAAAQRALRLLQEERLATGRVVAEIRHNLCSRCQRCLPACPYGARTIDYDLDKILVNAARCQGCGSCAAVCLNSAAVLIGYTDQQLMDTIDAALEASG
jgi:heterodisulfide reductase subunit A